MVPESKRSDRQLLRASVLAGGTAAGTALASMLYLFAKSHTLGLLPVLISLVVAQALGLFFGIVLPLFVVRSRSRLHAQTAPSAMHPGQVTVSDGVGIAPSGCEPSTSSIGKVRVRTTPLSLLEAFVVATRTLISHRRTTRLTILVSGLVGWLAGWTSVFATMPWAGRILLAIVATLVLRIMIGAIVVRVASAREPSHAYRFDDHGVCWETGGGGPRVLPWSEITEIERAASIVWIFCRDGRLLSAPVRWFESDQDIDLVLELHAGASAHR